jgi:hypothetical protein
LLDAASPGVYFYLDDVKIDLMRQPMAFFLILAPFATFSLLMLVAPAVPSLIAGAAVATATIAYDLAGGRSVKMLAAGSAILFTALAGYFALADSAWSSTVIRLAVDAGTLTIILLSIAARTPFTLQYAREAVDAETAKLPAFLMANYIITAAWAAAIVLMAAANLFAFYLPSLPLWIGIAIGFAARNAAVYFTNWYPHYLRTRHGASLKNTAAAS